MRTQKQIEKDIELMKLSIITFRSYTDLEQTNFMANNPKLVPEHIKAEYVDGITPLQFHLHVLALMHEKLNNYFNELNLI